MRDLEVCWNGDVHGPDRGSLDVIRNVDTRDRVTFPARTPPPAFRALSSLRYSFATPRALSTMTAIRDGLARAGSRGLLQVELTALTAELVKEHYLYEILRFMLEQEVITRKRVYRTYRYFLAAQEHV